MGVAGIYFYLLSFDKQFFNYICKARRSAVKQTPVRRIAVRRRNVIQPGLTNGEQASIVPQESEDQQGKGIFHDILSAVYSSARSSFHPVMEFFLAVNFLSFVASFFFLRVICFGSAVIHIHYAWFWGGVEVHEFRLESFFIGLLHSLFFLDLVWAGMIMKMVIRVIFSEDYSEVDDARSEASSAARHSGNTSCYSGEDDEYDRTEGVMQLRKKKKKI